jgi:hypothetical protein
MKTLALIASFLVLSLAACGDKCHDGECHAGDAGGSDSGPPTAAEAWCQCMLIGACHDAYHARYGEDHEAAEAACIAEAEAVPSTGAPATSGNSIECRQHYCDLDDETMCSAAFGEAPCM